MIKVEEQRPQNTFTATLQTNHIKFQLSSSKNLQFTLQNQRSLDQYESTITQESIISNPNLNFIFDSPSEILESIVKTFKQPFQERIKIDLDDEKVQVIFQVDFGSKKRKVSLKFEIKKIDYDKSMNIGRIVDKKINIFEKEVLQLKDQNESLKYDLIKAQQQNQTNIKEIVQKNQQMLSIMKKFLRKQSKLNLSLRWSHTLKGQGFHIQGPVIQGRNLTEYKLALIQEPLSKTRKTKWIIKMLDIAGGWQSIGISKRKTVQRKKFKIPGQTQLMKTGHGCYMISWNKGVWSHSQESINGFELSPLKFEDDDCLEIQFDPVAEIIRFSKIGGVDQMVLRVPEIGENQFYHGCVGVYVKGKLQLQEYEEVK